jgi:glycosyltransferase involved in cell wall biosynthesis
MNNISKPKVSVVVPNYNHARFLRRRIESVLGQSLQDFEVILLDDCSTDDSQSILSKYADDPRVRIDFNEKNSGTPFKQWNKGVRLARGEYVWIAESDDYADERLLERLVATLEAEPEVVFAYCRSWRVTADGRLDGFADDSYMVDVDAKKWTMDYFVDGRDECRNYFVVHNIVPNASAVLFRKTVYDRVGGADETLRMCADWKLWVAMALTGRVAYLSEPLNYYRFHDESVRGKDKCLEVAAEESLHVIRWMQGQIAISDSVLEKSRKAHSGLWIRPVVNGRVPLERRRLILRSAMAVDPHALRRLMWGAFLILIWGPVRVHVWHPLLDVTRPVRHALGLRQRMVRQIPKQEIVGQKEGHEALKPAHANSPELRRVERTASTHPEAGKERTR